MIPPALRPEFEWITEAQLNAIVAKAHDPVYMAKVKAMLDRIKSKPRIPTITRADRMKASDKVFAGMGHVVVAPTKSEARARLKQSLGIPRKGRLPVGFSLRCVSH